MVTSRRLQASERAVLGETYPSIRRFAAVAGPLEVDPDDLLGEALARTLRHRNLSASEDDVDRLRRAVLRSASTHRRQLGRERRAMARLHATGEGVVAISTDVAELLRLSPTVRTLLYLADVEEEPIERIADSMGTTPAAVRSTVERARTSLLERIDGPDALDRAFRRLADRGPSADPERAVRAAERRMAAVAAPPRAAPPRRPRLASRGWRRRRADFDRTVSSMAAGAAVAVFLVSVAVVGAIVFTATRDDRAATVGTAPPGDAVTTTTVAADPGSLRIVGWSGVGQVPATTRTVTPTDSGFVASGPGGTLWSPDGIAWRSAVGPSPGALVAADGADVMAVDPVDAAGGATLWISDDGGRTWEPVAGSTEAIPDIPGVDVSTEHLEIAATRDVVLAAVELRAAVDWPGLLEVEPERLSYGSVDGQPVVWVEPLEDESREGYRLEAIRSGSRITILGIRVSDETEVFDLRGSAGLLGTEAATTTIVRGGLIGAAVWRSEFGGGFESGEGLPVDIVDGALVGGGTRFTLVSDGADGGPSVWTSPGGERWEDVRTGPIFDGETLLDVARRDDDWLAMTTDETGVSFWASVDGRHWFHSDDGPTSGVAGQLSGSRSGWVATVDDGTGHTVYWSADGAEWAPQLLPTRDLVTAVATRSGVLAVDTDGRVWFGELS
ncbi:MAG: sigma-70 family RNA polymerase sigma factor [Acidimicrobiia bacterium]|nr:sigma-70 family RNA polymerase sigma factor [Acidimicrobiia bacterium]